MKTGVESISYPVIDAYERVSGIKLTQLEVNTIITIEQRRQSRG